MNAVDNGKRPCRKSAISDEKPTYQSNPYLLPLHLLRKALHYGIRREAPHETDARWRFWEALLLTPENSLCQLSEELLELLTLGGGRFRDVELITHCFETSRVALLGGILLGAKRFNQLIRFRLELQEVPSPITRLVHL